MDVMPVELVFPVKGGVVPVDHGYGLYSALSRVCPHIHSANDTAVHLIRGEYCGDGNLMLSDKSFFAVRTVAGQVGEYMRLAGRSIDLHGERVRIGIPRPRLLKPSRNLYAHIVVTRNGQDVERFTGELQRQVRHLGITGRFLIGRKRSIKVHKVQIVGYTVVLSGLNDRDSLLLQHSGLGGKRKMGCGVFVPLRRNHERLP